MGHVLIADDEEYILEAMRDVLESVGHSVVGVKDGEEALKLLTDTKFDVALIDVMMPKMDGYHLATKIHGLPRPPKIVIVTARAFEGDRQALYATGASAFLPKPFSNRDLIEVVSRLINSNGKGPK